MNPLEAHWVESIKRQERSNSPHWHLSLATELLVSVNFFLISNIYLGSGLPAALQQDVSHADAHLLGHLGPGFLQPVDGGPVQGWGDLQHAVVVVQASANVCHRHPLLNCVGTRADICVIHDLGGHQVTHLRQQESQKRQLRAKVMLSGHILELPAEMSGKQVPRGMETMVQI